MTEALSWIDCVPKANPVKNLEWRERLREAAYDDVRVQRALWQACMDDVLFYINFTGWLNEPRGEHKIIPFLMWPHQEPVALAMDEAISRAERTRVPQALTLKKSRGQGATYLYLKVCERRFLRDAGFKVGVVTRNEKLVDSQTDSDTILWKVWWSLMRLPYWMRPKDLNEKDHRSITDHTILNPENGSLFTGFSATADAGRGGRQTVFVLDEFGSEEFIAAKKDHRVMSSVSSVTDCIFMVSTFGGESGVFHEAATDPENPLIVSLNWQDNPSQTKLGYVYRPGIGYLAINGGEQTAVTEYVHSHQRELRKLERRGFEIAGKVRSPFYDAYCLLPGHTPRIVAREMDMDPRAVVGKVFSRTTLEKMKEGCRKPVWQGRPVFDHETLKLKGLIEVDEGPLKLWFKPELDNRPPHEAFVLGCDISVGGTGKGSSNSVCWGLSRNSGEQLVEYTVHGMQVPEFADNSVGLAIWLWGAYLGWETTGPGGDSFGKRVVEVRQYYNVYYRDVEAVGDRAKTKKLGWGNYFDKDKVSLFDNLGLAMSDEEVIPRSEDFIRECGEYEWVGGKIVHRPSKLEGVDERSHGDRVVAAGVADLLRRDRPPNELDKGGESTQDAPVGSIAWHEAQDRIDADWDRRGRDVEFGVSRKPLAKLRGTYMGRS